VADTYCKARGGSLLHSLNELTHSFISQELERMKPKLKSKLVWLGAKRETSSPNSQSPVGPGSLSALVGSGSIEVPSQQVILHGGSSLSGRPFHTSALHDFPVDSLFSGDQLLTGGGEMSPIFSPLKLVQPRQSLLQVSSGAGGSTSRGSQTFGLQTPNLAHQPNRSIEHTGRSLIISNPNQVASSFFQPPVPISPTGSPVTIQPPSAPILIAGPQSSSAASSSPTTHAPHRSLRPPALVSLQTSASSPQTSSLASSNLVQGQPHTSWSMTSSSSSSSSSSAASNWRWLGDAASETLHSPISSFMWAEDQPNNYNNQQDCIVLDGGKKWLWNDVTCELDYLPWVCQYRASTCGSPDRQENSTILELGSSSNSDQSSNSVQGFSSGSEITYACPIGHKLEGSRTRKCLYDGSWSGKAPKCHYVDCGLLASSIENGRVVYLNQSQTTFASQVKYVCFEDYVLVGDDTRQCQADGKWAGKQPYCAYKWCPVLQTIANGSLNVTSYSENSIASYKCNKGYKLIGNDTRQCLLGGKWTNQEPFCQYVECGQPKQVAHADSTLLNGTTNYLSVVEYTCHENYTLATSQQSGNKMICSHNNRWTGREPQCNRKCLPPLPSSLSLSRYQSALAPKMRPKMRPLKASFASWFSKTLKLFSVSLWFQFELRSNCHLEAHLRQIGTVILLCTLATG